jgi:hypothetical protein
MLRSWNSSSTIVWNSESRDPFCGDQQSRFSRELPVEADVPADLVADRPPALLRDPAGDRPGGDTTRLEQDHGAVLGKCRRDPGRLAGTRGGNDDDRAGAAEGLANLGDVMIHW